MGTIGVRSGVRCVEFPDLDDLSPGHDHSARVQCVFRRPGRGRGRRGQGSTGKSRLVEFRRVRPVVDVTPQLFGSGSRDDGLRDLLGYFHRTFVADVRTNDLDADGARRAAHIRPADDFQGQEEGLESRQTASRRDDARPAI